MEVQSMVSREAAGVFPWERRLVAGIVVCAFIVRFAGIGYGLPSHVFSDEEALIFGALKMLELKTLLPVFHADAFAGLLYYPPFLSYAYAFLFVPVLCIEIFFVSPHTFQAVKTTVIADPSALWYAARALVAVLGAANVFLVYAICRRIFSHGAFRLAPVFAAAFVATSFLDVTMSATAKHWVPTLFFSLLSVYLAQCAIRRSRGHLAVWSGISLGVSFGMGYLVFYFPAVALIFLCWRDTRRWENIFWFLFGFFAVALAAIIAYPGPFLQQVVYHTGPRPGETKDIFVFFLYYARALWRTETPLVLASIFGCIALARRMRGLLIFVLCSLASIAVGMYLFLWNIPRYLLPMIPFLAMLAGCAMSSMYVRGVARKRAFGVCVVAFLCVWTVAVYSRHLLLLSRNDTRIAAARYVETHVPRDAPLLVFSDRIRFAPDERSLAVGSLYIPGSFRSLDRILASGAGRDIVKEREVYHLFHVFSSRSRRALVSALADDSVTAYIFVDEWTSHPEEIMQSLISRGELLAYFSGEAMVDGERRNHLFIGGEEGRLSTNLVSTMYAIHQYGPPVRVYSVPLSP